MVGSCKRQAQLDECVRPSSIRFYGVLISVVVLAGAFAALYVWGEDGIYLWDYHGYWDQYNDFGESLRHRDVRTIIGMLARVVKADYNITPVILLQPFSVLFPDSRIGYIVAIVVLYLVPAALLSAYFGVLAGDRGGSPVNAGRSYRMSILSVLAVTFPPYWIPSLRGYPDIVGLISIRVSSHFGNSRRS